MLNRLVSHTRRNAIAYLALFVALGGTSYAVTGIRRHSIGPVQLRNGAVGIAQLHKGAVTRPKVDSRLLAQLQGQAGPKGDTGPQGPKGDTGSVDTSNFFTKSESDGRFLGIGGKAADSNLLDGLDSSSFVQGDGATLRTNHSSSRPRATRLKTCSTLRTSANSR